MPGMSTSDSPQSRRTFRCPSIPFYLKAIFLTCVSTAAYMTLRSGRFGESTPSETNSDSVAPLGNSIKEALSIKLNELPHTITESTPFLDHPVNSFSALIPGSSSLTNLKDHNTAILEKSENTGRQEEDKTQNLFVQRHLLQALTLENKESEPVVVANPIRDQFIQISETYTCDLSRVFSGDYFMIASTGLPDWLKLEYKQLGFYPGVENGSAVGVAVLGDTVFIAVGFAGLQILDVKNLTNPQLLSTYPAGKGLTRGVAVSGNTAFLANDRAGLQILDVSDLKHPQLLSTYPAGSGFANGVAISGNIAFVANEGAGLQILDVSDLKHPQLLSTVPAAGGLAYGVAVSGNTAFVANYRAGLQILNISNLIHPQLLSTYPAGSGPANGVAVSGNIVFVADGAVGLQILDVSDLRHPQLLSTVSAGSGSAGGVAVSGSMVFVANNMGGLQILDVSNPISPHLFSTIPAGGSYVVNVALSDNTVFVANGARGLRIPDLHSATLRGMPLAAEVEIGQRWIIGISAHSLNGSLLTHTFQLTVDDLPQLVKNTLTDQTVFPGEPLILSIKSEQLFSAPDTSCLRFSIHQSGGSILPAWLVFETSPLLLSTVPAGGGLAYSVAVFGNTVFLANRGLGLQILDVSDLAHPTLLSTYRAGIGYAVGVAVSGKTVFVANYNAGLQILDVSDLKHPQLLSTYPAGEGSAFGVAVSGNTVFVANSNALHILDVKNLTYPKLLSTYPAGKRGNANGVAILSNTVFMADGYPGLQVLDASDLTAPRLLSTCLADVGSALEVAIAGNNVFVADGNAGLPILDVKNLRAPQLLSTYQARNGEANGVAVVGNTVFVANGLAGLQILDVKNLTHPQLLGTYQVRDSEAKGVAVSDNIVFLANGDAGLYILSTRNWQLKISANPTVADAGNYYLALTATDEVGASVSIPFTLRVEGPPQVNQRVTPQFAEINNLFSFNIPPDTFTDPNFDPLTFDLSYPNQMGLPSWLHFNKLSVTLSGTPSNQDKGIVCLRFTAKDPRGQSAYTDFNLTVVNAPKPILDQPLSLVQQRSFNHKVPLETIFDGYGQTFTYGITTDSEGAVLPEWLNWSIVGTQLIFSGTPTTLGTVTLWILAQTNLGYSTSTPFILSVNPNSPPQVKQAISAQTATVGQEFDFVLPIHTFEGIPEEKLNYTAYLADGSVLPNWLTFVEDNQGLWHFKGTPGGWDTNPFSARAMTIQITAYNTDRNSAITLFNLTVNGTSTIGLLLKIATPLLSAFGLFQKRAVVLNRLCYKRRQGSQKPLEAGKRFSIRLSTSSHAVGSIEVKTRHIPPKGCKRLMDCQRFFAAPIHYIQLPYDPLPGGSLAPRWITYNPTKNTLEGKLPSEMAYRELIIWIKNPSGVLQEHFALKIGDGAMLDEEAQQDSDLIDSNQNKKSMRMMESINSEEGGGFEYAKLT